MEFILFQVFLAFIIGLCFSVLWNVDRRYAIYCGLTGAIGWLAYQLTIAMNQAPIIATFIGSLMVGLTAEYLARRLKNPATIFSIPGFVPLVPGSNIYYAAEAAVMGQTDRSIEQFVMTITLSAAIVVALGIASQITGIRLYSKVLFHDYRERKKRNNEAN